MLIDYENNPKASGQGFFVLTALPPDLADPAGLTFCLRRSGDGLCLGPDGWMDQEAWLKPEAVIFRGTQVLLDVGPAVLGQLAGDNAYQFALRTSTGRDFVAVFHLSGQDGFRSEARPTPVLQPAGPAGPEEEPAEENRPKQTAGAIIGLAIAFVLGAIFVSPYILFLLLLLLIPGKRLRLPEGNEKLVHLGIILLFVFFVVVVVVVAVGSR